MNSRRFTYLDGIAVFSILSLAMIRQEIAQLMSWLTTQMRSAALIEHATHAVALLGQTIAWLGLAWMAALLLSYKRSWQALAWEMAPGFGLFGTVAGLVGMLSDVHSIKTSLGGALLTTLLGLFISMAARLRLEAAK